MRADYPTLTEAATLEYVLEVFRDQHRRQCEYDPEAEPADLSFGSSVAEWREACDLITWHKLGHALNKDWGVSIADSAWRTALEPSSSRKLHGVCKLLAQHTKRPVVQSARLLGSNCDTAGAFLTVRSLLRDAGAQSDDIRPTTLLAPYARRFPEVFLSPVSMLSPGALPLVRVHTPVYGAASWAFVVGLIVAAIGIWLDATAVAVTGGAAAAVGYVFTWIAARLMEPASVEFGDLRTFGDLARVISRGSSPDPHHGAAAADSPFGPRSAPD